jgi:hypothetical protein
VKFCAIGTAPDRLLYERFLEINRSAFKLIKRYKKILFKFWEKKEVILISDLVSDTQWEKISFLAYKVRRL